MSDEEGAEDLEASASPTLPVVSIGGSGEKDEDDSDITLWAHFCWSFLYYTLKTIRKQDFKKHNELITNDMTSY